MTVNVVCLFFSEILTTSLNIFNTSLLNVSFGRLECLLLLNKIISCFACLYSLSLVSVKELTHSPDYKMSYLLSLMVSHSDSDFKLNLKV